MHQQINAESTHCFIGSLPCQKDKCFLGGISNYEHRKYMFVDLCSVSFAYTQSNAVTSLVLLLCDV